MNAKKLLALLLVLVMTLSLFACGGTQESDEGEITVTDMIGREVNVTPGSYKRVVCIGAGALRMYSYICGAELLAGVEDIDNESLTDRPKMFDSVARPYVIAFGDEYKELDSCGVGGPMAQTAEAEQVRAQAVQESMTTQYALQAVQEMAGVEDLRGQYF